MFGAIAHVPTPIGDVRQGDRLQVLWFDDEQQPDGSWYTCTVKEVTAVSITLIYPKNNEYHEWEEQVAPSGINPSRVRHALNQDFSLVVPAAAAGASTMDFASFAGMPPPAAGADAGAMLPATFIPAPAMMLQQEPVFEMPAIGPVVVGPRSEFLDNAYNTWIASKKLQWKLTRLQRRLRRQQAVATAASAAALSGDGQLAAGQFGQLPLNGAIPLLAPVTPVVPSKSPTARRSSPKPKKEKPPAAPQDELSRGSAAINAGGAAAAASPAATEPALDPIELRHMVRFFLCQMRWQCKDVLGAEHCVAFGEYTTNPTTA